MSELGGGVLVARVGVETPEAITCYAIVQSKSLVQKAANTSWASMFNSPFDRVADPIEFRARDG